MKFAILGLTALFSFFLFAQSPSPTPSMAPTTFGVPAPAPPAIAPASPVSAPAPDAVVPGVPAPPQWVQNLLVTIKNLPLIGPYVSKAIVYLGILSVVLTSLVAFLMGLLKSLSGLFAQFPQLQKLSAALEEFQDGKVMYWLKFFSNFNAQKPADSPAQTA
jgi:hypothetical protein